MKCVLSPVPSRNLGEGNRYKLPGPYCVAYVFVLLGIIWFVIPVVSL